jgi:hypothetical protein
VNATQPTTSASATHTAAATGGRRSGELSSNGSRRRDRSRLAQSSATRFFAG